MCQLAVLAILDIVASLTPLLKHRITPRHVQQLLVQHYQTALMCLLDAFAMQDMVVPLLLLLMHRTTSTRARR